MHETTISISGGAVFWSLNDTNRERLEAGLKAVGMEQFTPKERTPKAVLHDALIDLYQDAKTLVRPLEKRAAFTVVREKRGQEKNEYEHVLAVSVNDLGMIECDDWSRHGEITSKFEQKRQVLPGITVTNALVDLIVAINGVALRPTGGFYWLPDARLELWRKIAQAVEDAAVTAGENKMWVMQTSRDTETLRAVRDSITASIEAEIGKIAEEIRSNELGEKALNARVEICQQLRKTRLAEYEALLGESLDGVRRQISEVEAAAAQAVVLASSLAANKANKRPD